ncbi:unnamed protein product [Echinostoma caproni]|uniref:FHA domain-containing protein n=1 Tax=Echinostoma caproni TaxID=27848 RepID=A0A183AYX8_9TREM|nr:unnamed protein product [Echinostoma caproni]
MRFQSLLNLISFYVVLAQQISKLTDEKGATESIPQMDFVVFDKLSELETKVYLLEQELQEKDATIVTLSARIQELEACIAKSSTSTETVVTSDLGILEPGVLAVPLTEIGLRKGDGHMDTEETEVALTVHSPVMSHSLDKAKITEHVDTAIDHFQTMGLISVVIREIHCEIIYDEDDRRYALMDRDSESGTYLNGRILAQVSC